LYLALAMNGEWSMAAINGNGGGAAGNPYYIGDFEIEIFWIL